MYDLTDSLCNLCTTPTPGDCSFKKNVSDSLYIEIW